MAEEQVEFVVKDDCLVDGAPFYRGETKTVSKSLYRELYGAGRVAGDEAEIAAALRDRESKAATASATDEPRAKVEKAKA